MENLIICVRLSNNVTYKNRTGVLGDTIAKSRI